MGCIFSVGPVVPEILGVQSKKKLVFCVLDGLLWCWLYIL